MDFVTFDIAKKLKEKGFPQVKKGTLAMYNEEGEWYSLARNLDEFEYLFEDFDYHDCVCPTISQVLKWLREVHNVYIDIGIYVITKDMLKYNINVYHNKNRKDLMYSGIHLTKECSKYEEACEVALKYVLDNLI